MTTTHTKIALQVHTLISTWKHYLVMDGTLDERFAFDDRDEVLAIGQSMVDKGIAEWV